MAASVGLGDLLCLSQQLTPEPPSPQRLRQPEPCDIQPAPMLVCYQATDTLRVPITHYERIPTRTLRTGIALVERKQALLDWPGELADGVAFEGNRMGVRFGAH